MPITILTWPGARNALIPLSGCSSKLRSVGDKRNVLAEEVKILHITRFRRCRAMAVEGLARRFQNLSRRTPLCGLDLFCAEFQRIHRRIDDAHIGTACFCRHPCFPGTRMASPKVQKMTSGWLAISTQVSMPIGSTHTGQPDTVDKTDVFRQ